MIRMMVLALVFGCAPALAQPELVGRDIVSTSEQHESMSGFDPESGELIFSRANADFSESKVLQWSPGNAKSLVHTEFSTSDYDTGVTFSKDGKTQIITSGRDTNHPELSDEWNLFWSNRGTSQAQAYPPPVNSSASECCAVYDSGHSFLFSSNRTGSWDIFRATETSSGFFEVEKLGGTLNGEHDEWPGDVSADGKMMLFSSIRPGGQGGDDIFVACKSAEDDSWSAVRLDQPVNSPAYEDNPRWSPDGDWLYWSSWRAHGEEKPVSNIYRISLSEISLPSCE